MNDFTNEYNYGRELWPQLTDKRIFLTGGTGFFGRSLLEIISFLNNNYNLNIEIFLLTRSPEDFKLKFSGLMSENLHLIQGDITDFEFPRIKIDYILHFATPASANFNIENPMKMFDIIVRGTRRILDFAVQCECQKVLLASSGAAYGKQPTELTHIPETYSGAPLIQNPGSAYGEGKRVAELMGIFYSKEYDFEYKIARCFALVGPHLDPNGTFAIGNFIRDAITKSKIIVNGDGTPYRSYLYSSDLIIWLLTILLKGKSNTIYNVGSDQDLSISQLAEKVTAVVNPNSSIEIQNRPINPTRPDRYVPNISLAQTELNLKVWTPLEEAILKTAAAYRRNYALI